MYRHIFFDLDNTLWDFKKNSREVLTELYHTFQLQALGVPTPEIFINAYEERNGMMWEQYRLGKINKPALRDHRFRLTFWDMGLDASLAPRELGAEYIRISPTKPYLIPHTHEILSYLNEKYTLHIITNGFAEAQSVKLRVSELEKYFTEIIISEHTGFKKPDKSIFEYALGKAGAVAEQSLMVGDGLEADILGAMVAGLDTVFFNPEKIPHDSVPTWEIESLSELKNIL